ncbi:MAG: NAD-dependent epimerase/dehydratase family protein [Methylococcaceae bacterium]|nr:NAD-dependent epimerase/dehydratase family protein [Methylococcaceae bacterium]
MTYTVLGARGFIGKELVDSLRSQDLEVYHPVRQDKNWLKNVLTHDLGHVFYCIGLTADFRKRPFDTVEAHVCLLRQILEYGRMESLIYLSSTRVYEGAAATDESTALQGIPTNPGHLYNFSKLMGESLCLNSRRDAKIVRLSNVYGPSMESQNFLSVVIKEAAETGRIRFLTSPKSSKDFISLNEVVRLLPRIAMEGKHTIYNLASGKNTTNADIAFLLEREGIEVSFQTESPEWTFPIININRLESEFGQPSDSLAADLPPLLNLFRPKVSA